MKRNFLLHVLLACSSITHSSCQRPKKIKSKEFGLEIKTHGLGPRFEAFMYNTEVNVYDQQRFKINNGRLDENTLYVLKHHYKDTIEVVDTLKVKFEEDSVDSLYILSYAYLKTINMDNEMDESDRSRIREDIKDGASFSVSLLYNKKILEASQWGLRGVRRASGQADQLFDFINRRLPEEFKLY
ncbi:hypothetical protein GU926_13595 [Nibribacter ruber]|uniref:Uncharacterized protein n=1 Tax=Nibribacter ruber TaxID=2698458 RepID=A0A6P1P1D4_9BACT|nr:hypothetical protein [Nibribacter ruber]QHL88411.1 hypothetical protein GU926_13595 [Nibribacter ruber]